MIITADVSRVWIYPAPINCINLSLLVAGHCSILAWLSEVDEHLASIEASAYEMQE